MKTHHKLLGISFAALAVFTATPALLASPDTAARTLRIAPENIREHLSDKLTGQKVFGTNGESLGTIKDFAIATPQGAPVYAVVSAGGMLGRNNTLRLIPTNALQAQVARGSDGFTVPIDVARWNQTTPIDHESFNRGMLHITSEQHEHLIAPFRTTNDRFADIRLDDNAQLIRASDLRRKDVHAGTEEVGEIEGVVIDLQASRASVLLETEDDFAGREQLVLVPLEKLTFTSSNNDRIITSLTRNDFAQFHSTVPVTQPVIGAHEAPQPRKPAVISNGNLAPTGRTQAEPQSQEELLKIGARSVRDIIKAEPAYADANIDVKADYGKIVLSGTAPSEKLRAQIYDTAKGASGFPVLNNIVVKPERH